MNDVVKTEELTTPPVSEDVKTQDTAEVEVPKEATTEAVESETRPGEKTDPNLLLQSLQQEREKVNVKERENEALREQIKSFNLSDSDREDVDARISTLTAEISAVKEESQKKDIVTKFPVLQEKWEDFESYRAQNEGMSLETAAKAFLVDNGLYGSRRPGLEKPTGGDRVASPSKGITAEDAADLRKNNPRKYRELLRKGQLTIAT